MVLECDAKGALTVRRVLVRSTAANREDALASLRRGSRDEAAGAAARRAGADVDGEDAP